MKRRCFSFQYLNTKTPEGKAQGNGEMEKQTACPTDKHPSFQTETPSLLGLEGNLEMNMCLRFFKKTGKVLRAEMRVFLVSKSDWKIRGSAQTVIKGAGFPAGKRSSADTIWYWRDEDIVCFYLTGRNCSIKMIKRNLRDCSKKWDRGLALTSESFRKQLPWIQIKVPFLETSGHVPVMWLPSQK